MLSSEHCAAQREVASTSGASGDEGDERGCGHVCQNQVAAGKRTANSSGCKVVMMEAKSAHQGARSGAALL